MGWRGAQQRILENGLKEFHRLSGAEPKETIVSLGPCIRSCCYEVGEDVSRAFLEAGYRLDEVFRKDHLDLVAVARIQLGQCGAKTFLDSGICTACRTDLFYSYRREATDSRMWTIAGFRPQSEAVAR
jgi:copper oxidase (laccase) domain-containing protein